MQRLPGIASIFNQDRPEADEAYEAAIPGPSQYSPEPFNANGMYWQAPPIQALPFPQWQAQVVLASEHGNMDIDEHVHMGDRNKDSAVTDLDMVSETATLASNILRGIEQHGRRYQALREGAYFAPSDEQQFEAQDSGYIVQLLLDQNAPNVFFFSPISKTTGHVLDIGCGRGTWCLDVAEQFPNLMVHGVDLSPPPQVWMPPNCSFSVDDICEEWTWSNKWNLIYLRNLAGCFTDQQWTDLYAQAYEKLNPGGWIEQIENEIGFRSDDNTIRAHSVLYSDYRNFSLEFAERMGRPLDTYHRFRSRIESAGFVNVHEMRYKVPVGVWTRNQMFKEAGFHNQEQLIKGVEGYMIYPFTQFGHWSVNDTRKFIEECKKELAKDEIHKYYFTRRIWAQKPLWSPK